MKEKTKNKRANSFGLNILYILFFAFIIRILLSFFGTLQLDHGTFIAWSSNLAENGFKNFYNGWSDYLPGYLYILWILGKVNLTGIIPQVVLYKLPAIIADIATGYLIFLIFKEKKLSRLGLIGSMIYVFNPAIFANSALWGQVDSLTALTAIASVYFLNKKNWLSAAFLSIGTLIKPQTAFILPVILFTFIKKRTKWMNLIIYFCVGLGIFILAFIPFSNGNLINFIIERLGISANQYPFTSVNAFNFWGLFGFWKPDNLLFQFGGYLSVILLAIFLCIKNKTSPYSFMALIFATSFMFFTRMHERHLLPVFAPLAITAVQNPIFLIPYIGLSLTYLLNLAYSYYWISDSFAQILPEFMVKFVILIAISTTFFIIYLNFKNIKISWKKITRVILNYRKSFAEQKIGKNISSNFKKISISNKHVRLILIAILVFAFATRIYKLGNPQEMYFDEVYHAFTAKTMMGADSFKAWEWWNTPPEGFAYEWTHPPLAKLGMVLGMSIFGQNSFGWRIPGAMLGVGSVFLVYLIAKKIFDDEIIGLLSAGVFSLDGLPLVSSRIGMNDTYFLFFTLLSIYLFLKKKDFFSALAYGFALSSKWSALWAVPIFFILWLKRKKKFKPSIFWFLFLPFIIYLLSYLPMFTTGHDLTTWWGMQKQMWWYHTGLEATHAYSSPWWTWPFLIRPVYLYTSDEIGGFVSRIYMMGSPFVFWSGIVSLFISVFYAFFEREKKIGFIIFSYLIFFAPWAASPRIMFFYHYLPSIPFLAIITGYALRRNSKLILSYLLIGLLVFIYFYPHWAGLQVPLWLDTSYYWLSTWR